MRAPLVALVLLLALPVGPSLAKRVAPRPPVLAPPIVVLAASSSGETPVMLGTVDGQTGVTTPVLPGLPLGVGRELAVDPSSGAWALSFRQLDNGDPIVIDGTPRGKPSGPAVLVAGTLGSTALTVLAGDPKCTSHKVACFESPVRFEAGGAVLVTHSESNRWWMWNRRVVKTGAKPVALVDAKLAKAGASLAVGSDGQRAVYTTKTKLAITAWPAQTVKKKGRAKVGRAVAPVADVMSAPMLTGDHVFYFRRDEDQRIGRIAAWDLVGKREVSVLELPLEYPMWNHRFLAVPARGTIVFPVDVAFERADLYEVPLAGLGTTPPRRLVGDLHALLDVSPDGTLALAAAYRQPDAATRTDLTQDLVVIDLATGRMVRRIDLGLAGATIYDARFAGK